jgi:hypothetical protein
VSITFRFPRKPGGRSPFRAFTRNCDWSTKNPGFTLKELFCTRLDGFGMARKVLTQSEQATPNSSYHRRAQPGRRLYED